MVNAVNVVAFCVTGGASTPSLRAYTNVTAMLNQVQGSRQWVEPFLCAAGRACDAVLRSQQAVVRSMFHAVQRDPRLKARDVSCSYPRDSCAESGAACAQAVLDWENVGQFVTAAVQHRKPWAPEQLMLPEPAQQSISAMCSMLVDMLNHVCPPVHAVRCVMHP